MISSILCGMLIAVGAIVALCLSILLIAAYIMLIFAPLWLIGLGFYAVISYNKNNSQQRG